MCVSNDKNEEMHIMDTMVSFLRQKHGIWILLYPFLQLQVSMAFISLTTAPDAQKQLAETVRILREKRKFSRKTLAQVSTVPEATIKKFDRAVQTDSS